MGKPRDGKFPILPSTTRRGTTLNTSVALDSPSVMSKLLTPPQANVRHTAITVESDNAADNCDDASTVLDKSGSLGVFLDDEIARIVKIVGISNENSTTPVSSSRFRGLAYDPNDPNEPCVTLDDDLIEELRDAKGGSVVKNIL